MTSLDKGLIRQFDTQLKALYRLSDMVIISAVLGGIVEYYYLEWDTNYSLWLLLSTLGFAFFAELLRVYDRFRGNNFSSTGRSLALSWIGVIFVISMARFYYPVINEDQEFYFMVWVNLAPLTLFIWHFAIFTGLTLIRSLGRNSRTVAIIGSTRLGHEIAQIITAESWLGLNLTGIFDDRRIKQKQRILAESQDLAGNINDVVIRAKQGEIDIVYITLELKAQDRIKFILGELADTTVSVFFVPDLFVFDLLRSRWSHLEGIPIVSIYDTPFYGIDGAVKRMFDIIAASIILIIIAIPMLIIAISIKLTSPGPIIFKQRRYGFKGEEILVWKFRSMTTCDNGDNVKQATQNDTRITKLGAFLRRTSLDELPQFINVLQGHMSIIGPRPHAVAHNELYRTKIKGYMLRHKVKPGITGLAQIKGFRGETDTLEKMDGRIRYDLEYISKWSLWLDLKIFFLTVFKGFISSKAY
jgi:putative colanic acid biosysnthesis UDP-glucose lipid carrier transferase